MRERQQVRIGEGLIGGPSVLLTERPTASLDPVLGEVAALIASKARQLRVATILVAHDGTAPPATGASTLSAESWSSRHPLPVLIHAQDRRQRRGARRPAEQQMFDAASRFFISDEIWNDLGRHSEQGR